MKSSALWVKSYAARSCGARIARMPVFNALYGVNTLGASRGEIICHSKTKTSGNCSTGMLDNLPTSEMQSTNSPALSKGSAMDVKSLVSWASNNTWELDMKQRATSVDLPPV